MSATPDAGVAVPGSLDAWRLEASVVEASMGADARRGLSTAEAAARLARFGPNRLETAEHVPVWRKFLGQFENPLIYLLVAAVVVSLVAWALEGGGEPPFDAIVITAIIVANAVLGYVQEARAEQAVAALQRMAAATAGVVRDGLEERIPATDVVPGDILALAEGDAVAADGRLVEAASLMVAEASLTGESEAVLKEVGPIADTVGLGDRVNMVFGGTAVVRGRGRAVVTATAMATEMGNIAHLLGRMEAQATPLQREIDRIGRMLGIAVIAIAAVVVGAILLTADIQTASDLVSVLLVGVSLAVAAVPEGLPAVLSVVLALGVQRMASQRAIVKRLSSVETLGSASVICSDKTGTLTKNEMTIEKVVTGSGEVDVTGGGYRPEGDLRVAGRPLDDAVLFDEVRAVLVGGSLANDAMLREEGGEWTIQGDPTEAAFLVAEAKVEGLTETRRSRFERIGEVPFSSERKLMSTLHADLESERGVAVVTKGAPDVLLARCNEERLGGRVRPLSETRRNEILANVDRLADRALRPLAVAYRPLPAGERPPADESVERERVSRSGRDHRPAAAGRSSRDRRRARRRCAGADDYRRPPAHRGAGRHRPRHCPAWVSCRHGRRARNPRRGRVCCHSAGGLRLRPRRPGAQAADRRCAPGRRTHRRDDRRRRQRRTCAEGGGHRRRNGRRRHRCRQGGGGHDSRRRQLRDDRQRRP